MAISEAARSDLYNGLRDAIGAKRAETLMSAIPLHDLDHVATKGDIQMTATEMRSEMSELRAELREEMAGLRAQLTGEMAGLRAELLGEIGALRKSMTHWMLTILVAVIGAMATIGFAG